MELGALFEIEGALNGKRTRHNAIGLLCHCLVGRAYKLPAPSYEEAGTRVLTTDYYTSTATPDFTHEKRALFRELLFLFGGGSEI